MIRWGMAVVCAALLAVALPGGGAGAAAPACDTTFIQTTFKNGTIGGLWTDASNWSAGVPDATKTACINRPGEYAVGLFVPATVKNLILGSGRSADDVGLAARGGTLTVLGDYTQQAGSRLSFEFSGGGNSFTRMQVGGTARLSGSIGATVVRDPGGPKRVIEAGAIAGAFTDAGFFTGSSYEVRYDARGVTLIRAAPSAPIVGARVNVGKVSGTVRVRLEGSRRFVTLRAGRGVPVGSELDTTRGVVRLSSATRGGVRQSSQFNGGRFVVRQAKTGLTTAALSATVLRGCPRSSSADAAARRRRPTRRLFGSGKGLFRTKGRYGSATVRGTKWSVQDFCDRTVFRVTEGTVAVRDDVRRRSVTVRAGRSYTARRR